MEDSELYHLIRALSYGTHLQIGVIFFGIRRNSRLHLPHSATIHASPYCWKMKDGGRSRLMRCVICRELAINKVFRTRKPFFGLCVNGLYEYSYPVIYHDEIIGIIFVGNIYDAEKGAEKIRARLNEYGLLSEEDELVSSMEHSFDEEQCHSAASLIDHYIQMVLRLYPEEENEYCSNQMVNDLISYLEENSMQTVNFRTLSERFHYNEKYIGRQFKKETGMSIRQYLCSRRIENAMTMLRSTTYSVTEIAVQNGFNNVTYFNHCFVRHTGVSPTVWRKLNRK